MWINNAYRRYIFHLSNDAYKSFQNKTDIDLSLLTSVLMIHGVRWPNMTKTIIQNRCNFKCIIFFIRHRYKSHNKKRILYLENPTPDYPGPHCHLSIYIIYYDFRLKYKLREWAVSLMILLLTIPSTIKTLKYKLLQKEL